MKKLLKHLFLSASVASLASVAMADENNVAATNLDFMSTNLPVTSQQFVWAAGRGNLMEVRLSELALDRSQNPDVKSFAKKMIKDHSAAYRKLAKLAAKENLNCPGTNYWADDNLTNVVADDYGSTNNGVDQSQSEDAHLPRIVNGGIDGSSVLKGGQIMELSERGIDVFSNEVTAVQAIESLSEPQFDQAYVGKMYHDHIKTIHLFANAADNLSDADLKAYAKKTLPTLHEHFRMVSELRNKMTGQPNSYSAGGGTNSTSMPMGSGPL